MIHRTRIDIRTAIVLLAILVALRAGLPAQDLKSEWEAIRISAENYFSDPSLPHSLSFIKSLPQAPVPAWKKGPSYYELIDRVYTGLEVIREQLRIDPAVATSVAFALYDLADGRLEHWIDLLLGDRVRTAPKAILSGFRSHPRCLELSLRFGYLLCEGNSFDRPSIDEIRQELEKRAKALGSVGDADLSAIRDQCIEAIRKELASQIEFMRAHADKALASDVMDEFLRSPYPEARKRAYDHIVGHKDEFLPVLRSELMSWRDRLRSKTILERMICLAAFFKHDSLLPALEEMIEEPEFEWHCLYDCPLTFALGVYGYFGGWEPPLYARASTTLADIRSCIDRIVRTPFGKGDPRDYIKGPGVDAILSRLVKLDETELIRLAGAENPDRRERTAAAYTLEYTVSEGRNLKDLYWLAADDIDDASAQYRTAIYIAIFRAEKARQEVK